MKIRKWEKTDSNMKNERKSNSNIENEKIRKAQRKEKLKLKLWNNTIQWKENKYVNKPKNGFKYWEWQKRTESNIENEKREA